ncbi:VOC family protein [Pseudoalteromonas spongiae]|uniref:VOC family protein n=1 Tax=Pseudoalteromonas spongiae TaxID=298657 RepID=UPI000C2D0A0B|nr:VOC family protein [Pseudoalteromonas spongiae]
MASYTKHQAGTFCWTELCSRDWASAKAFYTQLFDWQHDDQPIGDDLYYTMLQLNGKDIGAMYQMEAERLEQKVPSHWLNYIAVDNVDATVEKAKQAGARVIAGPHDVMDAGRMAMFFEPNGAMFAIWQGNQHCGSQIKNEARSVCWNELASKDAEASRQFYSAVFGWQYKVEDMDGMPYTIFTLGDEEVAGMLEMNEEWGEMPAHWMTYFQVTNCDETLAKVEELGGTVCVPATDVPNVGRFSVINDPQGGFLSVIEM